PAAAFRARRAAARRVAVARNGRLRALRASRLARRVSQCVHAARRDGTGEQSPDQRGQAVRGRVRSVCGAGVRRDGEHHPGARVAPHVASVSLRRERRMTQPPVGLVAALLCASATLYAAPPAHEPGKKSLTAAEVLRSSTASDWRALDPQNTLYLELPAGRVVIELAPQFAPHHVANVEALARGHYFDGLAVMRAQDNYVVQWGDPDAKKPVGAAQRAVGAEFERALRGLAITKLPDPDTYAPEIGFVDGFPVAAEPVTGRAWLVHCYGMVGAGRDNDVDSGGGTELYVVIGQAPRHLDRNVTLLGRVVSGMERLSVMPRLGRALHRRSLPLALLPLLARLMDHLLALGGARVVPLLAQHLAPLRRQLLELVKILPHLRLLLGRQRLELLPPAAQRVALL